MLPPVTCPQGHGDEPLETPTHGLKHHLAQQWGPILGFLELPRSTPGRVCLLATRLLFNLCGKCCPTHEAPGNVFLAWPQELLT